VLLTAIGGIIMVLNRDGSDQPPPVSITRPTPHRRPSSRRRPRPTRRPPLLRRTTRSPRRATREGSSRPAGSIWATGSVSPRPAAGRCRRPARESRSSATARASSWVR
jgi:hypothetical protein